MSDGNPSLPKPDLRVWSLLTITQSNQIHLIETHRSGRQIFFTVVQIFSRLQIIKKCFTEKALLVLYRPKAEIILK